MKKHCTSYKQNTVIQIKKCNKETESEALAVCKYNIKVSTKSGSKNTIIYLAIKPTKKGH